MSEQQDRRAGLRAFLIGTAIDFASIALVLSVLAILVFVLLLLWSHL